MYVVRSIRLQYVVETAELVCLDGREATDVRADENALLDDVACVRRVSTLLATKEVEISSSRVEECQVTAGVLHVDEFGNLQNLLAAGESRCIRMKRGETLLFGVLTLGEHGYVGFRGDFVHSQVDEDGSALCKRECIATAFPGILNGHFRLGVLERVHSRHLGHLDVHSERAGLESLEVEGDGA